MQTVNIPNTPKHLTISTRLGNIYCNFKLYNITDHFPIDDLNSSILIFFKHIQLNQEINRDIENYISFHEITSIDDKIDDEDYSFMAIDKARKNGANYFFYLQRLGSESRIEILNEIMNGSHFSFI